ncbi:MAG: type II secretion system protein [Syntrophales bacterium]
MRKNQKGFTLIEIIAVLVILGVLAAVAVPKYIDLSTQARTMAAQGAIAEIKGRLSQAQAKYMMANSGTAPNGSTLFSYAASANAFTDAANLAYVGADFNATVATGIPITISVDKVQSVSITAVTASFNSAGD